MNLVDRRQLFWGFILLIIPAGITLSLLLGINAWLNSPLDVQKQRTFYIEKGMTAREIGRLLKNKDVIDSVEEFRWAIWIKGAEHSLKLGTVRVSPPLTLNTLIGELREKRPLLVRVQIQEGWPSWRIFEEFSRRLNLSRSGFRTLFENRSFLDKLNISSPSLEGYLFPETYFISADASHRDVLRQIVTRFHEVTDDLGFVEQARDLGYSPDEMVRLASIIQREARIRTEKPIVSAVFHNRLQRGIPLEADPTLMYGRKDFSRELHVSDLQSNGPFNTYEQKGLPPDSICSPDKSSLEASVNPADVEYLYFVAKGDGSHVFSETLEAHRKAVQKYQR